ncbi:hypothetical protein HFO61_30525 [Rhizobium leguminosarum]|uniref:hypothetical protein n=1 Tax=Rhizobium leguminosarum TaxID=384 RepID=UPI001C96E385|nr:hypothetical protein [Rhizobium leguminosarum]MBY5551082.1 hypothetical protein [Rhizobium leguminosarum]
MWPKSKSKKIAVAFHGVKINIDVEMPILKAGIIELLRGHPELALSRTRDGVLSIDQLTRDVQAREQQIALLQDADAASSYHASRIEIERTAKLLAIQAEIFAKQAPIVFVGDSEQATAVDFCFAAAREVAKIGDGEISYQVKALLQIAMECAKAEASAARAMIEQQKPKAVVEEPKQAVRRPPMPPLARPVAAPAGAFKLDPTKVSQPEMIDEPEPWKLKRMPFDPSKKFTAQEYVAHIESAYPSFGTDGLPGVGFDRVKLARLQVYAHFFREPGSNVVPLHKSDLDGLTIWQAVRKFIEEFFPVGTDVSAASLRVASIMSALLDAEDLLEEGADIRYLYNHLIVASTLLMEEVSEQSAKRREEVVPALDKPVVERMWSFNPDDE